MLNYLVFNAVEGDSYPVTFDFSLIFSAMEAECTGFAFWGHCNANTPAGSTDTVTRSFTIDLVKATDAHNYSPPE